MIMCKQLIFILLALAIVVVHSAKMGSGCTPAKFNCKKGEQCCTKICEKEKDKTTGFCYGVPRNGNCMTSKECTEGICNDKNKCECKEVKGDCKESQECCDDLFTLCSNKKCLWRKDAECKNASQCISRQCIENPENKSEKICKCHKTGDACDEGDCCEGDCQNNVCHP